MCWTFLDLPSWPRHPVLIGCLLLDCIASQRSVFVSCMFIPTSAVLSLACNCTNILSVWYSLVVYWYGANCGLCRKDLNV